MGVAVKVLALAGATALAQHGGDSGRFASAMPPRRQYAQAPVDHRRLVSARRRRRRRSRTSRTSIIPRPTRRSSGRRAGASTRRTWATRPSSASASAMPGTTGCASMSPANIAPTRRFKTLGSYTEFCPGGRCFDRLRRQSLGLGVPGQRLYRSRHLVVHHAVRRRRRRQRLYQQHRLHRYRLHLRRQHRLRLRVERIHRSGIWPGRSMPASPTTSPTTSSWNSPTAT